MEKPTILIPLEEYQRLTEDSIFLERLEEHGVDNWEGYSIAWEEIEKEQGME